MNYHCPRCDANEFAIDIISYRNSFAQETFEVTCRQCGGFIGNVEFTADTITKEAA